MLAAESEGGGDDIESGCGSLFTAHGVFLDRILAGKGRQVGHTPAESDWGEILRRMAALSCFVCISLSMIVQNLSIKHGPVSS